MSDVKRRTPKAQTTAKGEPGRAKQTRRARKSATPDAIPVASSPATDRWLLLVHQLPPTPPYLRAKIGQRLASVGALALKNSIYVLPARDDCREDFEWIAKEAIAGGGQAWIGAAEWLAGTSDEELRTAFCAQADRAYDDLLAACREELGSRHPQELAARGELAPLLASFRTRFERLRARDFFAAERGEPVAAWLDGIANAGARGRKAKERGYDIAALRGMVWVTRRDVFVDRIATAWLVRRFVDPAARFRFVAGRATPAREGTVRFDMADAEVTHEGDRCTFEVLLGRLALEDPALERLAQMVHDIDLHDARYAHPETAGLEQMLTGLVALERNDARRIEQGSELFDRLYRALGDRPLQLASAKRAARSPKPQTKKGSS